VSEALVWRLPATKGVLALTKSEDESGVALVVAPRCEEHGRLALRLEQQRQLLLAAKSAYLPPQQPAFVDVVSGPSA
jgi:hypothetical protein